MFLGRDANLRTTVFRVDGEMHCLDAEEDLLPGVQDAVGMLKRDGLKVAMITGDTETNARATASHLGIETYRANLSPAEKIDYVADLKAQGARVLMIGDGLNDTAALAVADASIAPSSALDATRNAADINIIAGNMRKVVSALRIGRTARRRIIENFAIAALYNAIAIPVAVAGLATPLAAAIAMSTSSITVILNAQRGLR